MSYCINCGFLNEDDAKFCVNCGYEMSGSAPTDGFAGAEAHEVRAYETVPEPQYRQPYQGPAQTSPSAAPLPAHDGIANQSRRTAGHGREAGFIAAALLCGALVGVGVALLVRRGMLSKQNAPQTVVIDEAEQDSDTESYLTLTFSGGDASEGAMSSEECAEGSPYRLPECGFTKDGFLFSYWESDDKARYAPGDVIWPEGDMTFSAVWTPLDNGGSNAMGSSNNAAAFPLDWAGSYEGYSQYVEGGTITRTLRIVFSSVTEDGKLSGICYIGANDPEAGTGSYYVEGTIDWDTRAISLHGTTWYKQEDVKYMRTYSGTVSTDFDKMTGTCMFADGSHSGAWEMMSAS